jgi:hypothetical protein
MLSINERPNASESHCSTVNNDRVSITWEREVNGTGASHSRQVIIANTVHVQRTFNIFQSFLNLGVNVHSASSERTLVCVPASGQPPIRVPVIWCLFERFCPTLRSIAAAQTEQRPTDNPLPVPFTVDADVTYVALRTFVEFVTTGRTRLPRDELK